MAEKNETSPDMTSGLVIKDGELLNVNDLKKSPKRSPPPVKCYIVDDDTKKPSEIKKKHQF